MNRSAMIAAVVSLLLALVATGLLLFLPCSVKSQTSEGTTSSITGRTETRTQTTCQSLLNSQGPGILLFTMLPVTLAALGVVFVAIGTRVGVWITTAVALLFVGFSILSIGAFYFPSAVAMVVAAVLPSTSRRGGPLEAEPTS